MKHFKSEEWVDFVNQVTAREQMDLMRTHLANGCKNCAGQAEMWRKVREAASAEAAYEPPEGAVRSANALFSSASWATGTKKEASLVQLVFDSFLQPAVAGARTAGTGIRQMLFRAANYQIDLQFEAKSGSNVVLVTGQVLDASRPDVRGSGLHVVVRNRSGNALYTATSEFGEFQVEVQNSGDLELVLRDSKELPIVIALGDPMDNSFGGLN